MAIYKYVSYYTHYHVLITCKSKSIFPSNGMFLKLVIPPAYPGYFHLLNTCHQTMIVYK